MRNRKLLITCEHADNYVPKSYSSYFNDQQEVLESHRGWDPGSLMIGKYLSRHIHVPFFYQKVSRLLIEMNRSLDNAQLFSEFMKKLDHEGRQALINQYYHPYRTSVEDKINEFIKSGAQVIHLSIHTFTPILNGVERSVDVGILFDDTRPGESAFCQELKMQLVEHLDDKLILFNCPYNGADDGFTTYLRTRFSDDQYLGIELEINQKYVDTDEIGRIKGALLAVLRHITVPTSSVE